jgi:general secretion pathway protein E
MKREPSPGAIALAQLDAAALRDARTRVLARGEALVDGLARDLLCDAGEVVADLARRTDMESIETPAMLALAPALDRLPLLRALERGCVLLRPADSLERDGLVAVIADPLDVELQIWLEAQAAAPVQFCIATPADITAYLSRIESTVRAVDAVRGGEGEAARVGTTAEVLTLASASDASAPAVRLINSTLYDALKAAASDIHLESTPEGLTVKLRIDGVLHHALDVRGVGSAEQAISRLKVLAELDIAERRVPQDGSFRVHAGGRDIDLRLSVMPSVHGEDAVIRILDKQAMLLARGALSIDALGFDAGAVRSLRKMAEQPHGMLLVAGPTGSGKTTTLYAAISEIHTGRDKIVTIEDPVEYQLPGVLQIPVHEKKGLTFARGLRSILRHDPDKIMVGEIRDRETAEIAVQAALTGHLVLTTVHANNVFDVFGRFAYLGIDPYMFVSALAGVWAQRLIRVNCARCSAPVALDPDEISALGLDAQRLDGYRPMKGAGCGDCRGTGYRGRRAIAEVLELNDELRELIIERKPVRLIREAARRHGARSLRQTALALVAAGQTTLEEVRRVTLDE